MRTPAFAAAARRPSANLPGFTNADPVRVQIALMNLSELISARTCVAIEQLDLVAEAAHQLGLVGQIGDLARLERDDQIPGRLEFGVDVEFVEIADEAIEVLAPEALERFDLVREPGQSVPDAVA